MEQLPESSTRALRLAASLDMAAAAPLAADLLSRRGEPVEIDAGEVRRIGGQCLQVLLAAQATWAADNQAFVFTGLSPEFADGLALLGASALTDANEG